MLIEAAACVSARRVEGPRNPLRLEFIGVYRQRQTGSADPPNQLPTQNLYRWNSIPLILFDGGQGEWIRTSGLLVPNEGYWNLPTHASIATYVPFATQSPIPLDTWDEYSSLKAPRLRIVTKVVTVKLVSCRTEIENGNVFRSLIWLPEW